MIDPKAQDLIKLLLLAAQIAELAKSQYQKFQTENNLNEDEMKVYLKSLNKEDADAFAQIIESASS